MKKGQLIIKVEPDSIAEELGIEAGDLLISINDKDIEDVFDYRYELQDEYIEACIEKPNKEQFIYEIEKDESEDLGITFESGLMDKAKSCRNKCIFCFIDQLPKGMRKSLYFKDDDSRLSFLQGNYVTLTNITEQDLNKVIFYHLSPINISIHTTDPKLRAFMLNNPKAENIMNILDKLHNANIEMNFQIVVVKGVNDKQQLDKSICDLVKYVEKARSLSIVPAGITKYREGLFNVELFTKEECAEIINQVESYQKQFYKKYNTKFVFAADEFYIKAAIEIPDYNSYEDFPQLENGVGMLALFKDEFLTAFEDLKSNNNKSKCVSVITSVAAQKLINTLMEKLTEKFENIKVNVYTIQNNFFGENVTVSGLLTGSDIIGQLKDKELGEVLLIPCNCLRADDVVFLDDVSIEHIEKQLNIKVKAVEVNGESFVKELLG